MKRTACAVTHIAGFDRSHITFRISCHSSVVKVPPTTARGGVSSGGATSHCGGPRPWCQTAPRTAGIADRSGSPGCGATRRNGTGGLHACQTAVRVRRRALRHWPRPGHERTLAPRPVTCRERGCRHGDHARIRGRDLV